MSNVNEDNEDIGNDLIQAAKKGDINEVRRLISEGVDVNAKDNIGWTPLRWAVKNNHSTTAEVLLDNGADLITFDSVQERYVWRKYQEIETEHCKNSLHLAARLGNLEAVEDLLGKGADVNAQNDIGNTPLHFAAENGHKEVVDALLGKDGINVNAQDKYNNTPLHLAAQMGYAEIVKDLLDKGANVNAKDKSGWTPLHLATIYKHEDIVKLLLDDEANVTAVDNHRYTPLHYATIGSNKIQMIRDLLHKGASVNAQNDRGNTPLHLTAENEQKDADIVLRILLERLEPDVNAQDKDGNTPLNLAIKHGKAEVVLRWAAKMGHVEIVRDLLKVENINVNAQDLYGNTLLDLAAENYHLEVMGILLSNGASPVNLVNLYGCNPLHLAVAKGDV
ncbi:ankyrin repeat domain-containing protein [Wolbachia endosymbiont (group A) of Myopa testacea]|uniref:ankyrin repeat domain-containing protein n=1 Tax=Wolbachia endosymbiont (group A) of Myopa testacea TaxID=3066148 RepID=UPI0031330C1E